MLIARENEQCGTLVWLGLLWWLGLLRRSHAVMVIHGTTGSSALRKAGSGGTAASAKGQRRFLAAKPALAGKAGAGATGGSGAEAGALAGAAGEAGEAGTGAGGGGTSGAGGGGTGGGGTGGTGGTGGGGTGGGTGGGGTSGAGGQPQAFDSLAVTVSGVPVGSTATVNITGPASYAQNISASTTLSALAAGSYTITAPPIRVPGTQVDSVFDATVTGSPAAVTLAAASTANVSYARRPGSGTMWVTNYTARNIFGFDAASIAKTGSQSDAPSVALTLSDVGTNNPPTPAIAFSATGDLWTSTCRFTSNLRRW